MTLKLYNTQSRKKEEFKPLQNGKISMYVCGPTVYDLSHLGHARCYVAFDVIRRYLEYSGYGVTYINNFTDVDDKIINRANEKGEDPKQLAEHFSGEFLKDMDALHVKRATDYPKATEYIEDMIKFIEGLIEKGYAYVVDGDVYYDVSKFADYGKLSHRNLEELKAGARVDVDDKKDAPEDFALWKAAKEGEPSWESPWGNGRPGWHIECSVMSTKHLGETLDIHGGGQDLIFPHHENEIAQSEAYTGKTFSNYWMHNGFITIDKEKMSKSLGNFFTVRKILEKYEPEVVRFFLISTHYRSPIDFSDELLKQAKSSLERIRTAVEALKEALGKAEAGEPDENLLKSLEGYKKAFKEAMDNDFNTRVAISQVFEFVTEANKYVANGGNCKRTLEQALGFLEEFDSIFNVIEKKEDEKDHEELLKKARALANEILGLEAKGDLGAIIQIFIDEREKARAAKDFERSDNIRDGLKSIGVAIEDGKNGAKWKID